MLAVYVDDMIAVVSENDCALLRLKLSQSFPMENLEKLEWYTGCVFEYDWEAGTLKLSQISFVDNLSVCLEVVSYYEFSPRLSHDQTQDPSRGRI